MNSFESALSSICDEFTKNLSATEVETPCKLLETNFGEEIKTEEHHDPRSPSIGIERTPIVFDKTNQIEILSNEIDEQINEMFKEVTEEIKQYTTKVQTNVVEKNTVVYEDTENVKYSTPHQQQQQDAVIPVNQRTPLSCLGNRGQSKIARAKPEIRKAFANAIQKSGNDENTPEMGKNIIIHNSLPKSNRTQIPIARRGLAPRN